MIRVHFFFDKLKANKDFYWLKFNLFCFIYLKLVEICKFHICISIVRLSSCTTKEGFVRQVGADEVRRSLQSSPLCRGSRQETLPGQTSFFAALLKLVTDWSPVQDAPRWLEGFFSVMLHLYSVDICNGCKINVSDVPVNVNKIKFILKGIFWWCDHSRPSNASGAKEKLFGWNCYKLVCLLPPSFDVFCSDVNSTWEEWRRVVWQHRLKVTRPLVTAAGEVF